MDKQRSEKAKCKTAMLGFLLRNNISAENFFTDIEANRLMTVKEMMAFDGKMRGTTYPGPLPYCLEDFVHQVRKLFINRPPEEVFAFLLRDKGFHLIHALAVTIARAAEERAKSAKAGQ